MNIFLNLVRRGIAWLIGWVLLLAAIGKLLDNRHFAEVLAQWQLFPHWSLLPLGMVASLAELVLALWLFSGRQLATAAMLSVLFHLGYSTATTITLLRGIRLPDCGCFGILFQHPLDWVMVIQDLIFTLLSVVLFGIAKSWKSGLTLTLLVVAVLAWAGVFAWIKAASSRKHVVGVGVWRFTLSESGAADRFQQTFQDADLRGRERQRLLASRTRDIRWCLCRFRGGSAPFCECAENDKGLEGRRGST